MPPASPYYPPILSRYLPWVLLDTAFNRRRSFRRDALDAVSRLRPSLRVLGSEHIPRTAPALVLSNHYYRPGFEAYWIPLAISAILPAEVRWVMTAERRYEHLKRGVILRPIEKLVLKYIAQAYGHFSMPAMPPHPAEVGQRAHSVRRLIHYVRNTPGAMVGLAPEGKDILSGTLGEPPSGAGRLVWHLQRLGLVLYPVGVFEEGDGLCLHFGRPFSLNFLQMETPQTLDRLASRQVMQHIAALLPHQLRGEFEPVF